MNDSIFLTDHISTVVNQAWIDQISEFFLLDECDFIKGSTEITGKSGNIPMCLCKNKLCVPMLIFL